MKGSGRLAIRRPTIRNVVFINDFPVKNNIFYLKKQDIHDYRVFISHVNSDASYIITGLFLGLLLVLLGSRSGLLGLLLENTLDNLLLLNKESTDDTVLDAVAADGTTVSTLDGLFVARCTGVLTRTEGNDTGKGNATLTALGAGTLLMDVQVTELVTGSLDKLDLVRFGVVGVTATVGNALSHLNA